MTRWFTVIDDKKSGPITTTIEVAENVASSNKEPNVADRNHEGGNRKRFRVKSIGIILWAIRFDSRVQPREANYVTAKRVEKIGWKFVIMGGSCHSRQYLRADFGCTSVLGA